jgi:hypothetical protein
MRMRKLGKGQSVVFFMPEEIRRKISKLRNISHNGEIRTADVLIWSIRETWHECHKYIPLWAAQGIRHQWQEVIWNEAETKNGFDMCPEIAIKYLENESKTLEQRYHPSNSVAQEILSEESRDRTLARRGAELRKIRTRYEDFGVFDFSSQTLQEEQERELATEIEEERQIEKPSRMKPHRPSLHRDVKRFVMTGEILQESDGFRPAFMALRDSNVARRLDLDQFRREILVTEDFVHTVKREGRKYVSDQYQRPVQWIVTGFKGTSDSPVEHMVVFSPWEVNKLLPDIRQSRAVAIHMYAPRPNLTFRSMEDLTMYTIPALPVGWVAPRRLILQLNLFAGQLYLRSYSEYTELCGFLGLAYEANTSNETDIGIDGFVGMSNTNHDCVFTESPVPFLKALVTQIRRGCQDIGRTDIGRILAGELLERGDFTGSARSR